VSINVLSVFGFILVLGLLVDDAIVTAESAYARLERDNKGLESVVGGVRRVTTATVFGALTTAVAFGPSLFLTEGFARVLSQLGWVVILCVIFSLIETKLVLPAHLRHIKVHHDSERHRQAPAPATERWRRQPVELRPRPLPSRPALGPCTYRYTTLSIFLAALIICLSLVPSGILRVVFFPSVPSDLISINPRHAPGYRLADHARLRPRIQDAARAMNERFKEQDAQGRDVIETMMVVSDSGHLRRGCRWD
jgi:multidrug efflux pump subunit AcrB